MSRSLLFLLAFVAPMFTAHPAQAGWEVGVTNVTAWSNNEYLGDPHGWSFFLTKSLSERLNLRGSFGDLDHNSRYIGTLPFVFQPPGPWSVQQYISGNARIDLYEVSLDYAVIKVSKMRLEVGGGLGYGHARLSLYGEQSGDSLTAGNDLGALSLRVQLLVKELIHSPLALRLAFQHRRVDTVVHSATDGFEPFADLALSSVEVGLLVRF